MSSSDDRRFAAELEAQRCRVRAAAATAAMERMRLDGWEPASHPQADDGVFAAELEAQRCRVRATAAEAEMEQMRLDNLERELLRRSGTAHSRPHSGPPHHRRAHTPPPPSPTPPSAQPPRSQGPPRPPHAVPRPPPRVEKEGRNIVFVVFRGDVVLALADGADGGVVETDEALEHTARLVEGAPSALLPTSCTISAKSSSFCKISLVFILNSMKPGASVS
ncbi:hypothetical protein HMN09_01073400 [Mycena chlorophos]|uniref:Uncharacterized protein n=1 Tax=Mycena chlorophos TaxID=658473 RepID=A0A8H6SDC7_MYCCL|nr:hypothetical protein HMN09_01073400 [Mycena chlorophos]